MEDVIDLVDAIPVTGFAVRLLGDPSAFVTAGDLRGLARDYPTDDDAWKAYHQIAAALGAPERKMRRNTDAVARLAVHALAPGCAPVVVGSTRAFKVDGALVWCDGCIDGPSETLRIMPDFGYAYCWCEGGCSTSVDIHFPDVPGMEAMNEAFEAWQRPFDMADWEPTKPQLPGFDWPPFHAAGIALSKRLKLMLADRCQVIYVKAFEDPESGSEKLVMKMRLEHSAKPV